MNNKTFRILLPALSAALLLSCTMKEPVPAGLVPGVDESVTPVTVSLDLTLDGERNGTPKTRAIDDPGAVQSTAIHTLCILQYNGTDDNAPLVGEVHFLRDDLDPEDENYLNFNQIRLADSQGAEHTLVILTNTFRQLPRVETLGEMLALWRTVEGEPDVFGHEGQGGGFPDDVDYFQRMNALVVSVIENDAVIKGTLRRSMARINVEIVNDGTDGLQIRDVQLRNVSMKDYYVTDYSYIDENDEVQLLRDTPFQDEYIPSVPMRADYVKKAWTGDNTAGEGTGTANYRWYVSSNMRGTDANNTLPSEKNLCPNAGGATYLYILARYGADADADGLNDELIEYKFYLGENLVNNFDLKPNTSYSYRLTFNGKGNTSVDKRINDMGSVNFPVDANSYIVNPPAEGSRKYTFNVVHRPNIFWGTPNGEDRYDQYGTYSNNWIASGEEWKAFILWSDVAYDMNAILTRKTGTGEGGYNDASQRVELTIPSDITEGNLVIGVYTDDPSNILWSWHVWITKYQPDDITGHAPDAGTYIYSVKGGEVHRYGGSAWTTGRYKDGYAMDRNLGALDDKYREARGGGFCYQFGRKDPFPASYTICRYDYDGNRTSVAGDAVPKVAGSATGKAWKNVPYSVNNPRTYITSSNGYWTSGDVFNPSSYNSSILWQDPYTGSRTDVEEGGKNLTKSIFDPCPPGWRLPVNGTWAHFTGDGAGSSTTSTTVTFQWNVETFNGRGRGTGRTYYPLTFAASKSNPTDASIPTIFFPASGNRESNGSMRNVGSGGDGWSSAPSSVTNGYRLSLNAGSVNPSLSTSRAYGFAVRCVRE